MDDLENFVVYRPIIKSKESYEHKEYKVEPVKETCNYPIKEDRLCGEPARILCIDTGGNKPTNLCEQHKYFNFLSGIISLRKKTFIEDDEKEREKKIISGGCSCTGG